MTIARPVGKSNAWRMAMTIVARNQLGMTKTMTIPRGGTPASTNSSNGDPTNVRARSISGHVVGSCSLSMMPVRRIVQNF